ncbi:TolC family protein [Methylobacterium sp. NEAU 140]|uniref:TolC family protein n=1 Tax=Methylobacterium sp. NEAU 140 TaxID=3064945 RepID=UPI0027354D98|nr:TolC family protein [Methylobacterium sp. NEAU 140]MDP4026558.1 TolC family protein [Methylobacterium sp. NEAU 140]
MRARLRGGGRAPAEPERRGSAPGAQSGTLRVARAILAALSVTAAAAPARSQSLSEASASALENSFALRADRARQEGEAARLRGALDSFLPTVGLVADKPLRSRITYSPALAPTQIGLDTVPRRDPTQVGVTADLPLFDGFRRWHTLQSARALAEAGRFTTLSARQQVLLDTGIAYLAVLREVRILGYRVSQVAAIARIRDVTERQFEVNDATRTDVALTRSRVHEAEAARDRAVADLAAARLAFKRLARMEPERMTPPRLPDLLPRDEAAYAELVRTANPGLAAARLGARAAGDLAQAATAEVLPQVNLQFSHVVQYGYSQALDRIADTTTRIVARVPLYQPGAFPRIEEASALARQRGYEVQDGELATLTAARTAFSRRRAVADQSARLAARATELAATMRGFVIERGAGFRTILDELNIRAELADAQVQATIVETERDALGLQLAAAANLLDAGGRGGPRFAAIPPGPGAVPAATLRLSAEAHAPRPVRARPADRRAGDERLVLRGTDAPSAGIVRRIPEPALRVSLAEPDAPR